MTPADVYNQINDTFLDWDGLLANPRFCRDGNFVSWTGFSGGRLKEPVTIEQILEVLQTKQFTFQSAEDGSIFQILYSFDESGILQMARLAFYLLKVRGSFEDGTAELISNSWVRLDYDIASASGILHHESHFHLHGFPDARIPVDGVPGPRQFVEFVVSICYPEFYKVHRLGASDAGQSSTITAAVNSCYLRGTVHMISPPLMHFALPKT